MSVRIVLAEDHALIRRELRRLLEAEESWLVCGEAENGEEAIRLCETLQPDVAALDINMPVMGGLEAARRIREVAPSVAVLIISMYADETLMAAVIGAGARGYVVKSEAQEDLVPAVRTLLGADATHFAS